MTTRDAYVQKIKDQIDVWNADITVAETKAGQASAEMKTRYDQSLESLRAQRDAAHQKAEEIKESADDAWEGLQAGADDFLDRSKAAFAAVKAEFDA